MDGYNARLKRDPKFAARRQQIEQNNQRYIAQRREEGTYLRTGVVVIPVVVHVVYDEEEENITDEQIQSQIDALNRDYRLANADASLIPGAFAPLAADTRIEFQLAVRDPMCGPTNGITRTNTEVDGFTFDPFDPAMTGNPVKFDATGGQDAWPSDKYLNVWVCRLVPDDLLGYSSFPGDPADVDGVVCDFRAFGTTGTAAAPFDLGRSAVHEVGHWLDVFHINGDDFAACTGSDLVDDTPNQADQNLGCPTFPNVSCSNGPDGDMFMNYMDYVDDACMLMFSMGQSLRMDATLNGIRASILASDGLIPPSASAADLWSQDTAEDIGNEPNNESGYFYVTDDIWVRNQNDGFTNQEHQNPIYRPAGPSNYVYIRVRNRGCVDPDEGTLKLYWAKASTGLAWPQPWDGTVVAPALMGSPIGLPQPTGMVPARGSVILEFPWSPPNPADYASFGADASHFCLLSRIETELVSPFGMTFPEAGDLGTNVKNNNNIVWKNISIVTEGTAGGRSSAVTVGEFRGKRQLTRVVFGANGQLIDKDVLQRYKVTVDLGEKITAKWIAGGKVSSGISHTGGQIIQVLKPGAWVGNLSFNPYDFGALKVMFTPRVANPSCKVTEFNVTQLEHTTGRFVGAERFVVKEKCR